VPPADAGQQRRHGGSGEHSAGGRGSLRSAPRSERAGSHPGDPPSDLHLGGRAVRRQDVRAAEAGSCLQLARPDGEASGNEEAQGGEVGRSEERRVGKEGRSRGGRYHLRKKKECEGREEERNEAWRSER